MTSKTTETGRGLVQWLLELIRSRRVDVTLGYHWGYQAEIRGRDGTFMTQISGNPGGDFWPMLRHLFHQVAVTLEPRLSASSAETAYVEADATFEVRPDPDLGMGTIRFNTTVPSHVLIRRRPGCLQGGRGFSRLWLQGPTPDPDVLSCEVTTTDGTFSDIMLPAARLMEFGDGPVAITISGYDISFRFSDEVATSQAATISIWPDVFRH